jgi:prolyl oligopeptidase
MQKSLDAEPLVVIDPNTLSEDGTVALRGRALSKDGSLLAYGLSTSGSDWQEYHIRNIDTGQDYDDHLKWTKFTSVAWKHDNSGFYYNRFPDPSTLPDEDQTKYNQVYWHSLGTPQSEDKHIYGSEEEKYLGFYPYITDDGAYLGLVIWLGTDDRNGIYFRKTNSDGEFLKLAEVEEAEYTPIDNIGSEFYFKTNLDAPHARIIKIDLDKPARKNWQEIIPESDDVIDFVSMINNQLIVAYMHHAHHIVKIFNLDGSFVKELDLPVGSLGGLSGEREDTEMFYSFSSFVYPSTAFRYDFKKDKTTIFRQPKVAFDPTKYEVKQVFYSSKDGTKVPMFLTFKKGLELNGKNPVMLYAYGGFNINMTPYFSISRLIWLEAGGIYAVPNLRGGGEYGEEWHRGGMLEKKQNVFDDFIAAAEWLIDHNYTSTKKLVISGGSNGGLLTAACLLQRPDLFGAVISYVPVTDMLRYHKFTAGRYWVPEYGNAEENPDHFKFMFAYSPLHNVKKGIVCPPTLVTSADTDDRVVPMHAKKFVATLQANDAGNNPVLIRIETKAGHGGGKPTKKRIEEACDVYAFLFKALNM